jgi:hypothetical protein
MRRKNTEPNDSTELLLDTMCNAFGGIVLIAILIAILTGNSAEVQTTDNSSLYEQVLMERIQSLEESIQRLKNKPPPPTPPGGSEVTARVKRAKEELLTAPITLEEHARTSKDLARARERIARLITKYETLVGPVPTFAEPPDDRIEKRGLTIPKMQVVKKFTHFLFFVDNKLYPVSNLSGIISRYDLNHVTYKSVEEYKCDFVELKEDGGITSATEMHNYLRQLAQAKPSSEYYIACNVHPNSFALFLQMKEVLREYGYRYNWSPSEEKYMVVVSVDEVQAQ